MMRSKIKLKRGDIWKQAWPLTYLFEWNSFSACRKKLPDFLAIVLVFLKKGNGVKVVLARVIQIDILVQERAAYNSVPFFARTACNEQSLLVQIRYNENKCFNWQFVHDTVNLGCKRVK